MSARRIWVGSLVYDTGTGGPGRRGGAAVTAPAAPRITARVPTTDPHRSEGPCLLWCGRSRVEVVWIGAARLDGQTMPLWACHHCAGHLGRLIYGRGRT